MAITALPTPPSRGDSPSDFSTKSDAFIGALPAFVTEANALQADVVAKQQSAANSETAAAASATTATAQAAIAAAAANYAGVWSALTGALATPATVMHNGSIWVLLQNLADVTTQEPAQGSSYWALLPELTDTEYAITGTTPELNPTNGTLQTWTLTADSAPTDGLESGQSMTIVITPGAYVITAWPTITWTKPGGGGAAPTLYSSGVTAVILWKVGATLYGSHLGDA